MIRRTNPPHAHTILIAILDLLKARELPSGQDLLSPLKVRMRKGLPIYPSVGTIRANSYWVPEAKRKPLEETRKKLKVPLFIPLPALEMVKTSSGHCKGLLTARNEGRLFATLQGCNPTSQPNHNRRCAALLRHGQTATVLPLLLLTHLLEPSYHGCPT